MTKDELQTKINGFIEEETADEKSKNTIRKYKHVATLFVNSALILYKNNIQQQIFAIYVVYYYKNGYKRLKIQ